MPKTPLKELFSQGAAPSASFSTVVHPNEGRISPLFASEQERTFSFDQYKSMVEAVFPERGMALRSLVRNEGFNCLGKFCNFKTKESISKNHHLKPEVQTVIRNNQALDLQKKDALTFHGLDKKNLTTQRLMTMLHRNFSATKRLLDLLGFEDPNDASSEKFDDLTKNQRNQMIATLSGQLQ